jgi:hypothetical protein
LIKDDAELPKIARMDGLTDLQDTLKADLAVIVDNLRLEMVQRCAAISVDEGEFTERLEQTYATGREQSLALIKSLKRSRKHLFSKELSCTLPPRVEFVGESLDLIHAEKKVRSFKGEVSHVRTSLEALEANTQSLALQLIDKFEDNYSAAMAQLVDLLAEFFQKAMGMANLFHDRLKDLAVNTIADFGEDVEPAQAAEAENDNEGGADEGSATPADSYIALLGNVDGMMEVCNDDALPSRTVCFEDIYVLLLLLPCLSSGRERLSREARVDYPGL